jgi:hypothetical protein
MRYLTSHLLKQHYIIMKIPCFKKTLVLMGSTSRQLVSGELCILLTCLWSIWTVENMGWNCNVSTAWYTYRIFSNLMRTFFTVLEGQKVGCVLNSRSRVGIWKNDTAAVHAVRTIQYNHYYLIYYCRGTGW